MRDPRLAGGLALAGAGLMLAGAAIWASTGTDLDRALATGEMPEYLAAAIQHGPALVANLSVWIVGVLVLGAAGTAMAGVAERRGSINDLARYTYWVAVPVAISAFVAWLAIIVPIGADPGATGVAIAEVVGWYAYRADTVATALIVGVGPALLSFGGRGDWVPEWLFGWGILAAIVGLMSFLPYFVPAVPLGLAMAIVPVGLGWTVAAAIVLLRRGR